MRKTCLSAAVAAMLLMTASAANATGFYVGGSLGQTSSDDLGFASSPEVTIDESDTGFKVFGGYNFFKFLSVEAAYVDVAGPGAEMTVPEPTSMSTEANGFAVEAMGVLPLGLKFQLFAEYGFFMWDGEATVSSASLGSFSASDDGTDPTYGLGFGWNVIPKGQIRVEAERYAVEDMDLDMYSAGFAYRF
jgi:OOP family OmpA-OmpF porin